MGLNSESGVAPTLARTGLTELRCGRTPARFELMRHGRMTTSRAKPARAGHGTLPLGAACRWHRCSPEAEPSWAESHELLADTFSRHPAGSTLSCPPARRGSSRWGTEADPCRTQPRASSDGSGLEPPRTPSNAVGSAPATSNPIERGCVRHIRLPRSNCDTSKALPISASREVMSCIPLPSQVMANTRRWTSKPKKALARRPMDSCYLQLVTLPRQQRMHLKMSEC